MKRIMFLLSALLVVGAGCSSGVNVTGNTSTNPTPSTGSSQTNTNDDSGDSGNAGTGNNAATTGVNVDVKATTTVTIPAVPAVPPVKKVVEFTVTGKGFLFDPKEIKVKKGDTVRITFVNAEGFHDWKLEGYNVGTKQIAAGKTEVVEFTADKAGTFEYYCSVGQHRQNGMKGNLIVQ